MSASQGKIARKWISLQKSQTLKDAEGVYTPAPYAFSYHITSVLNSGKGNQWYGFSVGGPEQVKDAAMYQAAKDFHVSMRNYDK